MAKHIIRLSAASEVAWHPAGLLADGRFARDKRYREEARSGPGGVRSPALMSIKSTRRSRSIVIPAGAHQDIAELLKGMLSISPSQRLGLDDLLAHPLIRP
jgi:hypothetical protein